MSNRSCGDSRRSSYHCSSVTDGDTPYPSPHRPGYGTAPPYAKASNLGPGAKAALILGIPLAALLVLCCGGSMVLGAMGSQKPKTTSATTAASPATTPSLLSPSTSPTGIDSPSVEPVPTPTSDSASSVPVPPPVAPTKAVAVPTTRKPPPPPPTTTGPKYVYGVHPGAFCSPYGALGYTVDGTLMRCEPSATDSRNRWRRA
jgi:hypothetical protein